MKTQSLIRSRQQKKTHIKTDPEELNTSMQWHAGTATTITRSSSWKKSTGMTGG